MSKWIEIGSRWRSEQACQVMELLQEKHIPSRVIPEEFSFMNRMMLLRDPDRRWPILVRAKDWRQAVDILAGEDLLNKMMYDRTE